MRTERATVELQKVSKKWRELSMERFSRLSIYHIANDVNSLVKCDTAVCAVRVDRGICACSLAPHIASKISIAPKRKNLKREIYLKVTSRLLLAVFSIFDTAPPRRRAVNFSGGGPLKLREILC